MRERENKKQFECIINIVLYIVSTSAGVPVCACVCVRACLHLIKPAHAQQTGWQRANQTSTCIEKWTQIEKDERE